MYKHYPAECVLGYGRASLTFRAFESISALVRSLVNLILIVFTGELGLCDQLRVIMTTSIGTCQGASKGLYKVKDANPHKNNLCVFFL